MTREEFIEKAIEKAKELAIDFWTMNLRDGTYESKFTELLDEYEGVATVKYNHTLDIKGLDLQDLMGASALIAGAYLTASGWEKQHSMSVARRIFRDKESDRVVVMEIEDDVVVDAWWHEGIEGNKWVKAIE